MCTISSNRSIVRFQFQRKVCVRSCQRSPGLQQRKEPVDRPPLRSLAGSRRSRCVRLLGRASASAGGVAHWTLHTPTATISLLSPGGLLKAILFDHHGGPDVLRYTDTPELEPRSGEVLVRVHACALNHLDLWVRQGIAGINFPLPHIPGSDIAGAIAKIGPNVTTIKPGQKGLLAPGVSCGQCPACLARRATQC